MTKYTKTNFLQPLTSTARSDCAQLYGKGVAGFSKVINGMVVASSTIEISPAAEDSAIT